MRKFLAGVPLPLLRLHLIVRWLCRAVTQGMLRTGGAELRTNECVNRFGLQVTESLCIMEVVVLQSGSNGNCIYVEADGVRLLFDAGISGRQAQQRLSDCGRSIADVQGLLISHDHSDHVRGMGIYQRKFGLPVYVSEPTFRAANRSSRLGTLADVRHFESGAALRFGHLTVETIPTPHDAADGVGFVVDDGTHRVGILTDLGHAFPGLVEIVRSLDGLIIESNYDAGLLASSRYSPRLRARIQGPGGHLSNAESAALLLAAGCQRLQWVCLGHLSEENNHPELAAEAHWRTIGRQLPLRVASRTAASDAFRL